MVSKQVRMGIWMSGNTWVPIYRGAIAHTYRIEAIGGTAVYVKADGVAAGSAYGIYRTIDVCAKKIEIKSFKRDFIVKGRYWKLD